MPVFKLLGGVASPAVRRLHVAATSKPWKKYRFSYLSLQVSLLSPKAWCTSSWQKHADDDECVHLKH